MKFKSDIEIQAGVEAGGSTGSNGQVLSSTGSGVAWIDQNAITSATDFVFFNVKNETGSTILKGKGVMAVGTDGNSGHILVDEMVADGTVEPKYFLGVLEEDIANGAFARVISFGQLSQFDTRGQNGETWADGQVLWCDPANNGDFTITEPDGPNVKIAAAFILNSSTNGKIQVRVQANEGVHDLHDTKITSQVDGDVLVWDNTTGVWFNDSTLNVDYTNSRVGIGTTSPEFKLDTRISRASGAFLTDGQVYALGLQNTDSTAGNATAMTFGHGGYEYTNFIASVRTGTGANPKGDLVFGGRPTDGGNFAERMRITASGNVGIGTTSPSTTLQLSKANTEVLADNPAWPAGILEITDTSAYNAGTGATIVFRKKRDSTGNQVTVGAIAGEGIAGNSQLSFWTGDSAYMGTAPKMVIRNTGNVGVGTNSPTAKLHLEGDAIIEGVLRADNVNLGLGGAIKLKASNSASDQYIAFGTTPSGSNGNATFTEKMRITSGGNVGIGTTDPAGKLSLGVTQNSVVKTYSSLTYANQNILDGYYQYSANLYNRVFDIVAVGAGDGTNGGSIIRFSTNPVTLNASTVERMRIDANGNVGIGTTSPNTLLQTINTSDGTDYISYEIGNSAVNANNKGGFAIYELGTLQGSIEYYRDGSGRFEIASKSAFNPMTFATAGSERIRILPNGNVGIGTTSPGVKLDVSGQIRSNDSFLLQSGTTAIGSIRNQGGALDIRGDSTRDVSLGSVTNPQALFVEGTNGNVGIGTTSPSEKLNVSGNILADSFIKDGGTSNQFLKADGSVDTVSYASTDNTYNKSESNSIFTSKTLSQNISFGESYASNYRSRVLDYGGTFFPRPLGYEIGLMKEQELFQKAKLSLLPSGVGTGKVHNIKPKNDTFDFSRSSTATYVDEDGLIQIAASNVPRLNYPLIDGVVSGCPSLLLEPERTNLITYSNDFSNSIWNKSNVSVSYASNLINPEGLVGTYVVDSIGSNPRLRRYSFPIGTHTYSVFLKAKDSSYFKIRIYDGSTNFDVEFDLINGTFTELDTAIGGMDYYGNGWYRCSLTCTLAGVGNLQKYPSTTDSGGVYMYGAQLEQGSYPTSYIPTTTSATTRSAETCNNAGDVNTFNDSEGVLMAEISALDTQSSAKAITINQSSTNELGFYYYESRIDAYVISGTIQFLATFFLNPNTNNKISLKYKVNDFALWVNGFEVAIDNIGTTPSGLNKLEFTDSFSNDFYGNTKQIQYFDTALTDTDLEELTSWQSFNEMAQSQLYSVY